MNKSCYQISEKLHEASKDLSFKSFKLSNPLFKRDIKKLFENSIQNSESGTHLKLSEFEKAVYEFADITCYLDSQMVGDNFSDVSSTIDFSKLKPGETPPEGF